jgi:hypothetical protein
MKVFQIEEPEGPPHESDGPGAAIGIALARGAGAVAFAVGGNAEILPGAESAPLLHEEDLAALLIGLRSRAEKQLARPVTHAVIAAPSIEDGLLAAAAMQAGLAVLDNLNSGTAPLDVAACEAARRAEDLTPTAS